MSMTVEEIKRRFKLPCRFKNTEISIWNESNDLKAQYECVDLAQGFPNFSPAKFILKNLFDTSISDDFSIHQYTEHSGLPRLRKALGNLYSTILNRELNYETEITITCGAYEALYDSICGNLEVGQELIIIEPFFDCYEPMAFVCGGIVRFIPLRKVKSCTIDKIESSADWKLDEQELRKVFNDNTKMIVVNTPSNPLGKVFSREELNLIAELCIKHDVICLSDEVYEWAVYEPAQHIRIASLPGMWERTLTVGSVGKSFGVTGWKCGWVYGPNHLMQNVRRMHEINTGHYITPIQEAAARCFEQEIIRLNSPECHFKQMAETFRKKRDYCMKLLLDVGLKPIRPDGGYFILVDWSDIENKIDLSSELATYKDHKFMRWMVKNIGLITIPPSFFFSNEHKYLGENYIRFCFVKSEEVLNAAANCMKKLRNIQNKSIIQKGNEWESKQKNARVN